MNVAELARRLCMVNEQHAHQPGIKPCGRHLAQAENYWGLASDPRMKGEYDVIVQFRRDKLGKGN